ncbi:transglutaminase domain-containing protein [Nocardia alba]|uniref:Transglutaminase superfamily protein n=1 Tax=Nocardia alba TaxID=225051 RepID=A0A4R1FWT5_9NOCA|nr:transglutaminase domain-containing protein [Nocardia alba]TCJ97178.1 transglutaminase superfamily protein [Nocardia alba]
MVTVIDYSSPGPLTSLHGVHLEAVEPIPTGIIDICGLAAGLVIQPNDAQALGLPDERFPQNQIRPVGELVDAILSLDSRPLTVRREPNHRVIGTCRHFAVISCALLRHRGIASRVRCGFATYFQPGKGLDHWITEYWNDVEHRWVRIDSEILGQSILKHPEDLRAEEFLSGGEAWTAFREGRIDAATFGVHGTANWGPAEIRGNAIKDLAALNKVETLPWDEWGRMTASYNGETGADYDSLLDTIAVTAAGDDLHAIAELYAHEELRVPAELIR